MSSFIQNVYIWKLQKVLYYTGGTKFYLQDAKHLLDLGILSTCASVQARVHIHEGAQTRLCSLM